jgi:hypothetical protein
MQRNTLVLAICVSCLFGCTVSRPSITEVQFRLGTPDVISDRSGDQERFYSPYCRPVAEWPADAPRAFYYLSRDLMITFVGGREVSRVEIPSELRSGVLQRVGEVGRRRPATRLD